MNIISLSCLKEVSTHFFNKTIVQKNRFVISSFFSQDSGCKSHDWRLAEIWPVFLFFFEHTKKLDTKGNALHFFQFHRHFLAVKKTMENPVHDGSTSTDFVSPPVESTASVDVEVQSETKEKLNDLQGQGVKAWFMSYLFPRVTPIHWGSFLILSLFTALPAALYVAVFTKIGWGMDSFYYFSLNYEQYSYTLGCSLAGAAFLLYMFDCYYWSSAFGKFLRKFFLFVMVLGISLLVLFMSAQYPYGPASLFVVLTTLWLAIVRKLFFRDVEPKVFVSWLSGPMFVVATICFLVWFIWTFLEDDNEWNPQLKLIEASQVGCKPDFVKYPDCVGDDGISVCYNVYEDGFIEFPDGCAETCKQVYDSCFNSFIIWMGPFLVSCGLLFLSFVATFLREDKNPENETTKFARVWLFLLFGMWVGASLSGAGAGFSSTLAAITLASFIAASIFLSFSYGKIERKEQLTSISETLKEKYGNHFDTFRGLLVVTCAPIFLIYFFVSFLIQRIRDVSCYVGKPSNNTESLRNIHGSGWLTVEARRLLREFQSWNMTKVFTIAIYWGLAFQVLSVVVAQFTLLFLSWLIETTSEMNLGVVTGILVLVGLIMFLLPPVPGVPIYLTLGIVIIPVGRETMGIVGSICYALVVSLFLKLFACALQQEAIGGLLKHKVGVRQFVGINSNLIRSMKLVLSRPGLGVAKVSIVSFLMTCVL